MTIPISIRNWTAILGDCLEEMKKIPDGSIDCILTDPPYGMNFRSNYRKERYDSIKNDDWLEWIDEFIDESYRVLKSDTHAYFFCSWHNVDIFKQSIQRKFEVKNILIWVKNNTGMGDLFWDYAPKHEFIIYARKGKRKLNGRRDCNILEYKRTGNKLHPTEKPVDLFEFLISKSTLENQIVFDPFGWSFTTAVAAENTGRRWICIEKEPKYFEIGINRIQSITDAQK